MIVKFNASSISKSEIKIIQTKYYNFVSHNDVTKKILQLNTVNLSLQYHKIICNTILVWNAYTTKSKNVIEILVNVPP